MEQLEADVAGVTTTAAAAARWSTALNGRPRSWLPDCLNRLSTVGQAPNPGRKLPPLRPRRPAATKADQALLSVLRTTPANERPAAAEAVFTAHGLGAVRHRIHVLAPASVSDAADAVFRALRDSRSHVATADPRDGPALETLKARIGDLRDRLKAVMREDIATTR
ncbi:hypothetical protein [Streptomyces virginiae]|uniref:hypothetical protein n=1 Tax=Streptomyces virginiae TaxID=1961 RepID=UPI0036EAD7F8